MDLEANTACFQQVNTALPPMTVHHLRHPHGHRCLHVSQAFRRWKVLELTPWGSQACCVAPSRWGGAMQWESPLSDLQKDSLIGVLNVTHSHLCTLFRQSHSVQ